MNFSLFALYSLLLLSFFLYLKSVPIHVIVHVHVHVCMYMYVYIHVYMYVCCVGETCSLCGPGQEANVMPFSYNVDPSFPKDLLPLIPNK